MEENRPQSYEERFLALSTKLERFLFRIAVLGFAGVLASQLILSVPELRQLLSVTDRLEGQKISGEIDSNATLQITTKEIMIRPLLQNGKTIEAWVKINGTPVARIQSTEVKLKVKDKDKIEIDTSKQSGVFQFEIDHNDPSIYYPTPGTVIESSENHAARIDQVMVNSK